MDFATETASDVATFNRELAFVIREGTAEVTFDSIDFAMAFAVDSTPGASDANEAMKEVALPTPLAIPEPTSSAILATSGKRFEAAASSD